MRYTGPKMKLCRREGVNLFGSEKYALANNRRKPLSKPSNRMTQFGIQLRKKQAAKRIYGIAERQFRNYYLKAIKDKSNTVDAMRRLLETRFDNVVLKANFARTMMQARQFVSHGHFQVNGKNVNIPSFAVSVGDVITVRANKLDAGPYKTLKEEFEKFAADNKGGSLSAAAWLTVDPKKLSITLKAMPEGKDFDQSVDVKKIIEFYSK